jgi:hypothetical protein
VGEHMKRARAKQFRHLCELGMNQLRARTLFTNRPELLDRAFECDPVANATVAPGDLVGVAARDDGVEIWLGNRVVGSVASKEADHLARAVRDGGGVLPAQVHDCSELTRIFSVLLLDKDRGGGNGND